jgi:hypothetical protein
MAIAPHKSRYCLKTSIDMKEIQKQVFRQGNGKRGEGTTKRGDDRSDPGSDRPKLRRLFLLIVLSITNILRSTESK